MLDGLYESPMFTPPEALAVTGLAERTLQVWIQRGFLPRATRPGRGVRRQFSLSDLLYLKFLRVASDGHVPLGDASLNAMYLFPAFDAQVPLVVKDILRSSDRPDLAPQVFAIFHDGQAPLIVTKGQIDEARGPTHEGADWGIVVNVTRVILMTLNGENGVGTILARRAATEK